MNKAITILFVVTSLFMGACSSEPEKGTKKNTDQQSSMSKEFMAYLKFKRIPVEKGKRLDAIKKKYDEREALAAAIMQGDLLDKGLVEAELREFRKEMLISRYFEKFLSDKVGEDAIKNYYTTHASEFEQHKARVSHLLFRTTRNMPETERQVKLTTAKEAYSRTRAGEDFSKVVEAMSEDLVSAKKGGDLGWLPEGSIAPAFSKKVFSMKAGEISEPFETAFGYHVIRVEEGPLKEVRPLESAKGDIRYRLRNQFKNEELKRLRAKAKTGKSS